MKSGSWSSYVEAGALGDDDGLPDEEIPMSERTRKAIWLLDVVSELVRRGYAEDDASALVTRARIDVEDCWSAGDDPRHTAAELDDRACGVPGQDDGAF